MLKNDLSSSLFCRERVSVRSVEEGGGEIHELGDDGAGLQWKR